MKTFDILIGRKILDVRHNKELETLTIKTDIGKYVWEARGQCCSYSYIHHMPDKSEIIGEVVTASEDKQMNGVAKKDGYTDLYLSSIITKKGHFDIEYRNDSNGQYGGWLELVIKPKCSKKEVS